MPRVNGDTRSQSPASDPDAVSPGNMANAAHEMRSRRNRSAPLLTLSAPGLQEEPAVNSALPLSHQEPERSNLSGGESQRAQSGHEHDRLSPLRQRTPSPNVIGYRPDQAGATERGSASTHSASAYSTLGVSETDEHDRALNEAKQSLDFSATTNVRRLSIQLTETMNDLPGNEGDLANHAAVLFTRPNFQLTSLSSMQPDAKREEISAYANLCNQWSEGRVGEDRETLRIASERIAVLVFNGSLPFQLAQPLDVVHFAKNFSHFIDGKENKAGYFVSSLAVISNFLIGLSREKFGLFEDHFSILIEATNTGARCGRAKAEIASILNDLRRDWKHLLIKDDAMSQTAQLPARPNDPNDPVNTSIETLNRSKDYMSLSSNLTEITRNHPDYGIPFSIFAAQTFLSPGDAYKPLITLPRDEIPKHIEAFATLCASWQSEYRQSLMACRQVAKMVFDGRIPLDLAWSKDIALLAKAFARYSEEPQGRSPYIAGAMVKIADFIVSLPQGFLREAYDQQDLVMLFQAFSAGDRCGIAGARITAFREGPPQFDA